MATVASIPRLGVFLTRQRSSWLLSLNEGGRGLVFAVGTRHHVVPDFLYIAVWNPRLRRFHRLVLGR